MRRDCTTALALIAACATLRADDVIRVGLVQMDGKTFDKEYNLARAEQGIREAAARGAKLIGTPEVAVQGYPRLKLPVGMLLDDPSLATGRARILAAAEPIPGPATERFSRLARELGVWIVAGMDENRQGKLFNSAVLINPAGGIAGVYSKVHLQNWMLASGVNHGDGFPVWDVDVGGVRTKLGIEICYDIQHPESTRELALGGVEVVMNPYCTNDFARPLLVHLFQTRALENRIFLARVHYAAPHNNGGSAIFDFEGGTQDELDQREGVLVADLNLTALRKVRSAWNKVYGPENRYPSAYHRIAAPAQARSCDALTHLALANTRIESARVEAEACRVGGVIEKEIRFEVWLPTRDWNGKYLAAGNGGMAGSINLASMTAAIGRGYATASTDTGHSDRGAAWALGHPERVANYGYRAHHLLAETAKKIVTAYYGESPRRSYFASCSAGGYEGLTEAQRYPGDYDGIAAGDPALSILHLKARQLWIAQMIANNPAAEIPAPKISLIANAVTEACDAADGVKDGLISDPSSCHFDYAKLQCPGPDSNACLTPAQVRTAQQLYGPAGSDIYPSPAPGTPLAFLPGSQPAEFFRYFVLEDPDWDWRKADAGKLVSAATAKLGAVLDSTNPDLRPFRARGGKLILYTGWMDPAVSPFEVIRYYRSVEESLGKAATNSFFRLFLAPGMGHCGGGPGPNAFDAVSAIDQWVENDAAPDRIVASHKTNGKIDRTRPLCPYPQLARYRGTGSTDDAASFVCSQP